MEEQQQPTYIKNRTKKQLLQGGVFKRPYIGLSGIIGAGKTEFAKQLSAYMDAKGYYEPVEKNPLLGLFYDDMEKHAFPLQIQLFLQRFSQGTDISFFNKHHNQAAIQDRTIFEDKIFLNLLKKMGHIHDEHFKIYEDLFSTFIDDISSPDLIIYLSVDAEVAFERVKERDRKMEKDGNISLEYLQSLKAEYEEFMKKFAEEKKIPILTLNWNKFRPIETVWEEEIEKSLDENYQTIY